MPLANRTVSKLQARSVLIVILVIMAWGQYHTNQQLNSFHTSGVSARTAQTRLIIANHKALLHLESQLAHAELQLTLLRKGQP